jgi:LacI family transcriptional regulator
MPASGGDRGGRPATLRDVAAAAGVDASTVSKVLNDKGISVKDETRQRILREVERTGYRPHAAALSLRMQRTGALGLLFPALSNPTYATIAEGAITEAAQFGYVVLVGELAQDDADVLRRLGTERRVDGLIIATARPMEAEDVEGLPLSLPYVYVNRRVENAGRSITVDDRAAGQLAAETLIGAGHTQLAFVGADPDLDTAQRRREGFLEACTKAGVPPPGDIACAPARRAGFAAAKDLVALKPRPTAAFASSLLIANGLLAGLDAEGVDVPAELSIITLDAEEAEYARPALTAVRLPFRELGGTAVRELHRILQGERPRDLTLPEPPELIWRRSVTRPG